MKYKTHQEIDNHYRNLGVDVDGLKQEIQEGIRRYEQARINVKKRRSWLKHFFIILLMEYPLPPLGWIHPEEKEEYEKLTLLARGKELSHKKGRKE